MTNEPIINKFISSDKQSSAVTSQERDGGTTTIQEFSGQVNVVARDANGTTRGNVTVSGRNDSVHVSWYDANGQRYDGRSIQGPQADRIAQAWHNAVSDGVVTPREFDNVQQTANNAIQSAPNARGNGRQR